MRESIGTFIPEALPEMDPVMFYETTDYGWRGITQQGEVLEVKGANGHKVEVPSEVIITFCGNPIGRRPITKEWEVDIDDYLHHFNRAVALYKAGDLDGALWEVNRSYEIAPTLRTKFNRAMILLASGRWNEGLAEYWECEQAKPFMRPQVEQALSYGLKPWAGQPYKRLLVLHAHGFGDTLMCLRYIPLLGKEVVMVMPPELHSITEQFGRTVKDLTDADYFCPILHLLYHLKITPEGSPTLSRPYIKHYPTHRAKGRLKRIGIAWSVGKPSTGDYPRTIDLGDLVAHLSSDPSVGELHSVQTQGAEEAARYDVVTHEFEDFLDCASLMSEMDEVISVDTAALHLAGATGHPRVYGLLSHWHSWRWCVRWYDNVTLLRQPATDDWAGALRLR